MFNSNYQMIAKENAYAFVGGAFVGRYGGIIPTIIVSGVLLYVADSELFTVETVINVKSLAIEVFKNITNT